MLSVISIITSALIASNVVAALGPSAVPLGTAANYVILAKAAVSTVPTSAITGDLGLSPAAGTYYTGFALTLSSDGTYSTSTQVVGKLYAANYVNPTPSNLGTAIGNMATAYTNASGRSGPNYLNLGSGAIGGLTLAPGLYKWTSGVTVASNVIVSGSATDTWIFQIDGTFGITAGKRITLAGGALPKNIVWVVAGAVDFGAGAHFEGIILAKTSVIVQTGGSGNGRILSQTAVSLQSATITKPA